MNWIENQQKVEPKCVFILWRQSTQPGETDQLKRLLLIKKTVLSFGNGELASVETTSRKLTSHSPFITSTYEWRHKWSLELNPYSFLETFYLLSCSGPCSSDHGSGFILDLNKYTIHQNIKRVFLNIFSSLVTIYILLIR